MRQSKRNFGFEQLESRTLLTGNVFIGRGIDTAATIRGDNSNNAVSIRQVSELNGLTTLKIVGLNGTKLVNSYNEMEPIFKPTIGSSAIISVSSLDINLHGGNDLLKMQDVTLPGTLAINMGMGNDTLKMTSVHFAAPTFPAGFPGDHSAIQLGAGDDFAVFNSIGCTGDMAISAGNGRDIVKLWECFFYQRQITVDMGHGDFDRLRVDSSVGDSAVFTAEGRHAKLIRYNYVNFNHETELGFKVQSVLGPFPLPGINPKAG
jgi:hypothetical protein